MARNLIDIINKKVYGNCSSDLEWSFQPLQQQQQQQQCSCAVIEDNITQTTSTDTNIGIKKK